MSKPVYLVSALLLISLAIILVLLAVDPRNELFKLFSIESNNILPSSASASSSLTVLPKLCTAPKESDFPPLLPPPNDAPAVIKDYIEFHKRGRHCLLSSECEAPPILLYDNPGGAGGFGYRIATIRWAFLFAMATRRLLFIPWPKSETGVSFDITTALHPASIDWRTPWDVLNAEYLNNDKIAPGSLKIRRFASFATMNGHHGMLGLTSIDGVAVQKLTKSNMFNLSRSNFTDVFKPFDVIFLYAHHGRAKVTALFSNRFYRKNVFNEFLRTETFITVLERLLCHILFRPSQVVSNLVDQRVFSSPPQPFVSVHMRTGDDVNETHQARMHYVMDHLSLYADRMLDCAVQIHPAGEERIFLASDSMTFKHLFIERAFLRNITVMTQQERSSVHFKTFVELNESEVEVKCMQFIDVFADVFALGRAEALVGRLSSFTTAGITLGGPKRAIELYLPEKQKKRECDVEGIVAGKVKHFKRNSLWYNGPLGKVGMLSKKRRFRIKNWS